MKFTSLSPASLNAALERRRCQRIAPRLVPYSEGRLGQSEREAIAAHLSHCLDCREELDAIESVSVALAGHAEANPAPFSVDLWTRIEAEIRPANADADWANQPHRKRMVFGIDPSWPNSVPVGVAIASAAVFAVFLVNSRHGQTPQTEATMTAGLAPAINISIRPTPSASIASLVSMPSVHGIAGATKAKVVDALPAKPPEALAEAQKLPKNDGLSDPFAPFASRHASAPQVHSAPAIPLHMHVTALASNAITHSSPTTSYAAFRSSNATKVEESAVAGQVAIMARGNNVLAANAASPALEAMAQPVLPGTAADTGLGLAIPSHSVTVAALTRSHANATTSDATIDPGEASTTPADDATMRGNTPTALPMMDVAAASRRQRGLFSYASH